MEIVAPAGDIQSLIAAINAGADAVYLGIKGFGARRNAANFYPDELCQFIDYAHLRGVKLYLTLNTIMKDREIEAVYENLKKIYEAGIDAVIVQDFGLFDFINTNFKDLEVHASTQMTIKSGEEAQFLFEQGFKRVVPSRELSFEKIKELRQGTDAELEIFVSGSLCVCYSGKCYMSSMIGGKSGNRGMCAQPCRKLYKSGGEKGYFISPNDQLMGAEEIKLLKSIGVESIKIEGRMKSPEYIYETVRYYRALIDGEETENSTGKLFNRGYGKGYFYGADNIINREYSAHFGYKIAERIKNSEVYQLSEDIKLGDGIAFINREKKVESGEYINKIILENGDRAKAAHKGQKILFEKSRAVEIYKTFDKTINDELANKVKDDLKKIVINGKIEIETGKELKLEVEYNGITAVLTTNTLEKSEKRVLEEKEIKDILGETGNTVFQFDKIEVKNDNAAFVSFKMLKEIKRECLKMLENKIVDKYKRKKTENPVYIKSAHNSEKYIVCSALVRTKEQEKAAREAGCRKIYYDYDSIYGDSSENELVKNIAGIIKRKDKEIVIDKTMNVLNKYALNYFSKINGVETVFLSPEISLDEIEALGESGVKKGLAIYGKPMVMYIETGEIAENVESYLENENGDRYKVVKNERGSTEIYMERTFNVLVNKTKIRRIGIDEVRFDFTFENGSEVNEIVTRYMSGENIHLGYEPLIFEKGVF